jgi:hypothetical protein
LCRYATAAAARAMGAARLAGDAAAAADIVEGGAGSALVMVQEEEEEEEDAAAAAAATFARNHAPVEVLEAAKIITGGASAAASMVPSMVVRAIASMDAATSRDVFTELRLHELGPIIAAAGAFRDATLDAASSGGGGDLEAASAPRMKTSATGLVADVTANKAAAKAEYHGMVLPAFASAVVASAMSPKDVAKAVDVAALLLPADAAAFIHAVPLAYAAAVLTLASPASTAKMLEKSTATTAVSGLVLEGDVVVGGGEGAGVLGTTARLVGALAPHVAAAAFEQLPSGVAAGICELLPVEFLARVVASMSARCAGDVVARLSRAEFAAEAVALVDPAMHAAAVLSAMKPSEAMVGLAVFTAVFTTLFCSLTHSIDDSQYVPSNQSDTRE